MRRSIVLVVVFVDYGDVWLQDGVRLERLGRRSLKKEIQVGKEVSVDLEWIFQMRNLMMMKLLHMRNLMFKYLIFLGKEWIMVLDAGHIVEPRLPLHKA